MLRLYIVGCGGIGGYVTQLLSECCASLCLDFLEQNHIDISQFMNHAGNCALPSIVDSITLIDGDTFDPHNAIRQGAGAGNKMMQRMLDLQEKMIRKTFLRNIKLDGYNCYLTPQNIGDIIPVKKPEENAENRKAFDDLCITDRMLSNRIYTKDIPVIFVCVDNAKTRYELSMYAEAFDNVLVVNGGNEKTTGQCNIYEREDGQALDPNLPELFDNIRPNVDKRPDEIACTIVAPKHDQVALTNCAVAIKMMEMFTHWVTHGTLSDFPTRKGQTCRYNEVVLDENVFKSVPLTHTLTTTPQGGNT